LRTGTAKRPEISDFKPHSHDPTTGASLAAPFSHVLTRVPLSIGRGRRLFVNS
jgi:hypothetical protein